MDRRVQPLLVDVTVGLFAGLFANWATDLAQGPLRRATPEGVRRREARVIPSALASMLFILAGKGHNLPAW